MVSGFAGEVPSVLMLGRAITSLLVPFLSGDPTYRKNHREGCQTVIGSALYAES
jgi:hypothetical protein